jgi:hypothetical protein
LVNDYYRRYNATVPREIHHRFMARLRSTG